MSKVNTWGTRLLGPRPVVAACVIFVVILLTAWTQKPVTELSWYRVVNGADEGFGELRWVSDVYIEGQPTKGLASGGYVLLIPMEAHDQWWTALGEGRKPLVNVEYHDGNLVTPLGSFQGVYARTTLDLLDQVAAYGTVSEVSRHGYFPEPSEPGLYWACVAQESGSGLYVTGCDIVQIGERRLVLEESEGRITATSGRKDWDMDPGEGW